MRLLPLLIVAGIAAAAPAASETVPPALTQCIAYNLPPKSRLELCTSAINARGLTDAQRAHALRARAAALTELGEWSRALADYNAVVDLGSANASSFVARATLHRVLGQHPAAIADLRSAARIDSRAAHAILDFGEHQLHTMRDFAGAILYFDAALEDQADNVDALIMRAIANDYRGEHENAFRDLDRALKLAPDSVHALASRGIVYSNASRYMDAIADFDRALRLAPHDGRVQYQRGHALFRLGRFADAGQAFGESARRRPDHLYSVIWHYLARARSGENAASVLEAVAGMLRPGVWPGPVVELLLDRLDPNDLVQAAEANSDRVTRDQLCEAHFYIGQYFLLQGDKAMAIQAFRNAVAVGVREFIEHVTADVELRRLAP